MFYKSIILKLLLLLLFYSFTSKVYSQTIRGKIKDLKGKPIEFATIQLLSDSINNQATLSDSLGNYLLNASKKGNYKLVIKMLGYNSIQKEIDLENDTAINFILKTDTTILNEVTITGHKDIIQAKSDRLIVNISGNIETKGKQTSQILKQLPSVNVSEQSLNIFGKSSVIVYINNRIVRLQGQALLAYLNSLPPEIINNVEIITSPPAQYDAEGNVGIIKINTKKNILPGWKEFINAGYIQNTYSSYFVSAFVNYTGKKIFFEGSLTNGNYSYLNQSNYYSYFPTATTTTFNPKKWNYNSTKLKAPLGYDFNNNTNIIADFQIPIFYKETITDIKNQTDFINPVSNRLDSTIYSNGNTNKNNYTYNSELFFKHQFSNGKSYVTASAAYLKNYTLNNRAFISLTEIGSVQNTTENYYTEGKMNYNILTSKADFVFPLLTCNAKTGFKVSFIDNNSKSDFYIITNDNKVFVPNLSNKFNYNENVQAVYFSWEKSIKDWSFKGGIRSEITQTIGHSIVTNESHKNDYINFLPSVYISHNLKNSKNISISYANRIERPPYQYLDPFKWYISKYDYAIGNPFLRPSKITNVELNYQFNNSLITKLYYSNQNDKIGQLVVLDSLNIANQIQETDNFLNINTLGINIYKLLKLHNWVQTILQGDFAYSEFLSNRKEFPNISGVKGTFIMNNTFFIKDKFQFICNAEENIPGLYNYRNMKNSFRLDIGVNYILSKKGLEARLLFADVFKTSSPEYYYVSEGIMQTYKNYYDSRMLQIIISWRFGNWYNKSSKVSSSSNIEEKQRLWYETKIDKTITQLPIE